MKTAQKKWTEEAGWTYVSKNGIEDKAQLVFLFGDSGLLKDGRYFEQVKGFYPSAHIVGCSTAGEIIGTQVFDNSLAATAVFFEDTKLQFAKATLYKMEDSFQAGEQLAETLGKEGLVHVFVLSDGLNVNGSDLTRGLMSRLPDDVAVTGGLAGDQDRFKDTYVFSDSAPGRDMVAAIGFYGSSVKISYGSKGGWRSFGPDRLVTRSEANVLYELDGQPALELYKKYLGDQAKGLPATALLFPLSLRLDDSETGLVRTILSISEENSSMTFAGDVPEGSYVRFMRANVERLVEGAAGAAGDSRSADSSSPDLAILISCVGRKLVMKQRVEEEVEAVQDMLGQDTAVTGFYSYGEICPTGPAGKQSELHNQTMTITTFSEK